MTHLLAEPVAVDRRALFQRWAIRVGLAVFAILLLINLSKMLRYVAYTTGYPYSLDYGEGIVWQQMLNIVAGKGYQPIGVFPAIVYHYPPVYHLTTAAVAAVFGMDGLYAGRWVSFLSTAVMMVLSSLLAASAVSRDEPRAVRICVALIAGLCLTSCYPVAKWSALMRVDMLATAFSLAGLLLVIRAPARRSAIVAAAILFVLAIYTKQTSIAAPAASFLGLLLVRPKAAFLLLAVCVVLGLSALGWLSAATDGGFLRHIILYNINRLDLSMWQFTAFILLAHADLLVVAGIGAFFALRRLRDGGMVGLGDRCRRDASLLALLILSIFLPLKTLMLLAMLKSGSTDNYMVEWFCAVAIFVGLAVLPALRIAFGHEARISAILTVLVVLGLPFHAYQVETFGHSRKADSVHRNALAHVVDEIRASAKPVISDDMTLLIRAGRPVLWEPAITAELSHAGLYDDKAFAAMVRRGDFGFFVTEGDRGERLYDSRYNPVVADAIGAAYPRKEYIPGLLMRHLPAR
jgi:4-amino-4-deoxy-L-arabinose transferase-like glycosyltransferase